MTIQLQLSGFVCIYLFSPKDVPILLPSLLLSQSKWSDIKCVEVLVKCIKFFGKYLLYCCSILAINS